MSDGHLKSFIDRILRMKEEQDNIAKDIRNIYAEAKGEGYDKTALGEVVAYLRKVEKKGKDAVAERTTLFDLYLTAYEQPSHAHVRARPITGEVHDDQPETESEAGGPLAGGSSEPAGSLPDEIPSANPPSAQTSSPEPVTAEEGITPPVPSSATISDDDVPAFLRKSAEPVRKTAADYRTHCLTPSNCASSSLDHCYTCRKAMAESEVAA